MSNMMKFSGHQISPVSTSNVGLLFKLRGRRLFNSMVNVRFVEMSGTAKCSYI